MLVCRFQKNNSSGRLLGTAWKSWQFVVFFSLFSLDVISSDIQTFEMKTCFVLNCPYSSSRGLFRVPKDEKCYVQWRELVGKGKSAKFLSKSDYVCHQHFKEEEVVKGREIGGVFHDYSCWKLCQGVAPSLNLPVPSNFLHIQKFYSNFSNYFEF